MTDIIHELPTGWRRTWRGSVQRMTVALQARVFTVDHAVDKPFRLMLLNRKNGRTRYSDHRTLEDACAVGDEAIDAESP